MMLSVRFEAHDNVATQMLARTPNIIVVIMYYTVKFSVLHTNELR